MPEAVSYLEAVVGADITSFRRAMAQVRSDLTGVHTGISQTFRNIGRDMTYGLTVPLAAIGGASLKLASDFDASMRNISSISEDFANNFDEYSAAVLRFGASTRSGAQGAAEALYQVISAGVLDFPTAMAIMQASVETAEAGLANLEDTTKGLTQVMLAFRAEHDTSFASMEEAADHYGNVLTRTVQLGVGPMNEFVTSIGRAATATATAGGSFVDLGSSMAFLTQQGLTAYNAGTAVNNLMNKLISPTDAMREAFEKLGVTTSVELFQKFGDLAGVMAALKSTVGDNTEAWGEMFNTIQARRAAFAIMRDIEYYSDYLDEFNAGLDTATGTAREQQMKSFAYQVELLGSGIKALGIQIGQALVPVLVPAVQKLQEFFAQAIKLDPAILQLIIGVGALVAALGPLLYIIGTLLSPMGLLTGTIVALGTAFATNFNGIKDTIVNAVSAAVPSLGQLGTALEGLFNYLTGANQWEESYDGWDYLSNDMAGRMRRASTGGASGTSFTVNPGDTLWDLQAATGLSVEDMMAAAGIEDARMLQPGTYTTGASAGFQGGLQTRIDALAPRANSTFAQRLSNAWAIFGDDVKAAITGAIDDVINWVSTHGAFHFGRLVGSVVGGLALAATSLFVGGSAVGGEGNTGLNTFASRLAGNIELGFQHGLDAVDLTYLDFRKIVVYLEDEITAAISDGIKNVITWISTTGANLLGQVIGTIAGGLVNALIILMRGVGKGEGGTFVSDFATNLSAGIQEGLENTLIDQNSYFVFIGNIIAGLTLALGAYKLLGVVPIAGTFLQNVIKAILGIGGTGGAGAAAAGGTGVAATIGKFIGDWFSTALSLGINMIKVAPAAIFGVARTLVTGLAKGVIGVLKLGISAFSTVVSLVSGSTALSALVVGLFGILSGALVGTAIYTALPQETKDNIATAVLDAFGLTIDGIDSEANLEIFRRDASASIYNLFAGLFDLVGDTERAEALREMGREAGAAARDLIMTSMAEGMQLRDINGTPVSFQTAIDDLTNYMLYGDTGQDTGPAGGGGATPKTRSQYKPGNNVQQATGGLRAVFDGMKTEVDTGMTKVKDSFSTGFTDTKTIVDTSTVDMTASLNAFVLAIFASIPSVAVALASFTLTVGLGMSALLTTVNTYANKVIAKWNEMLATMGAAPAGVGYTPQQYMPVDTKGNKGTVIINVKTESAQKINEAFNRNGVNLMGGTKGLVRTEI